MSSDITVLTRPAGDPNGNVAANVGSLCLRGDGNDGTTLYTKISGSDSAGWEPLVTRSQADSLYVEKAGDTMTGPLTLSGDPTQSLQAATKQYVDNAIDAHSGFPNVVSFTASGTWTVPAGVDRVLVEVWGAGGGGAGGNTVTLIRGAAGGGGGYAMGIFPVTAGATIPVTVGTGGTGGGDGNPSGAGTAGGNSAFGTFLSASGGGGAPSVGNTTTGGGNGGTGSSGQLNMSGANGQATPGTIGGQAVSFAAGGSSPRGGLGGNGNVGDPGGFPGGGGAGGNHVGGQGDGAPGGSGLVFIRY